MIVLKKKGGSINDFLFYFFKVILLISVPTTSHPLRINKNKLVIAYFLLDRA